MYNTLTFDVHILESDQIIFKPKCTKSEGLDKFYAGLFKFCILKSSKIAMHGFTDTPQKTRCLPPSSGRDRITKLYNFWQIQEKQ